MNSNFSIVLTTNKTSKNKQKNKSNSNQVCYYHHTAQKTEVFKIIKCCHIFASFNVKHSSFIALLKHPFLKVNEFCPLCEAMTKNIFQSPCSIARCFVTSYNPFASIKFSILILLAPLASRLDTLSISRFKSTRQSIVSLEKLISIAE